MKLYRSRTNRVFMGVLGGLGAAYNIDPNLLRIVAVALAVGTGVLPVVLLYLLASILIPEQASVPVI